MLFTSAVLAQFCDSWSFIFFSMGALMTLIALFVVLPIQEVKPSQDSGRLPKSSSSAASDSDNYSFFKTFRQVLMEPATMKIVALILIYKLGESLGDLMFKP